MRFICAGPLLAALLLGGPLQAADLTKISLGIVKEPAYQTKAPGYLLLVFGLEAETKVWIVRDGNRLFVDRNGNGDLTEAGKCITSTGPYWTVGDIVERDGKTTHKRVRILAQTDGTLRLFLSAWGKCRQSVGMEDFERPAPGASPKEAPILHLAGPMTFAWYGPPPKLSGERGVLQLGIGTHGVGKGTFAAYDCCRIPDTCPVQADFVYSRAGGGEPIRVRLSAVQDG